MYYVYMLSCKDNTIYTGITTDVKKRVDTHEKGIGAKYTRGRGPFVILGIWEVGTKSEASKVEYFIKKLPKLKKIKIYKDVGFLEKIISIEKEIIVKRQDTKGGN